MLKPGLDRVLSGLSLTFMGVALLGGPWLFGAWEIWYFWPMVACLGLSLLCFAARLAAGYRPGVDRPTALVLLSALPFLLYGVARVAGTGVYTDAERSVLVPASAVAVGAVLLLGYPRAALRRLRMAVLVNTLAFGAYGIVNHWVGGGARVLWEPAYPDYAGRASGAYYCPDHYAGMLEIGLCLALGSLVARRVRWHARLLAMALAAVALGGVLLSKSRGGGLTVVVIGLAVFVSGFAQWSRKARPYLRAAAVSALVAALLLVGGFARGYTTRFRDYLNRRSLAESRRAQMIGAAWRVWRDRPLLGIGPGMHQNLWPSIGATADGDRATGRRPSRPNSHYHSYAVHSDWMQLLEEYGLVGFALFAAAAAAVLGRLLSAIRRTARAARDPDLPRAPWGHFDAVLTAWLACLAMGFHSLGDFNLQIPATTWTLAALVAVGLAHAEPRVALSSAAPRDA